MLLEGPGLALRQRLSELLARLPQVDPRALHALADTLGGSDPEPLTAFIDTVNAWLSERLTRAVEEARGTAHLARIAQTWEVVNRAASDTDRFNLERRPLVFSVFDSLAQAARSAPPERP
jgi:DNA polymerase-3 subunit delta'